MLTHSAAYSVGALLALVAARPRLLRLAQRFPGRPDLPRDVRGRGGRHPVSHLPGLTLVAGFAMGIGAMSAAMLRLPLVSVLLATLLMGSEGVTVMPLVIVAVVVSYVVSAWFVPSPAVAATPASAAP